MEKKNIFKLFLGVVCFLTMLGCEQKKENAEENFSCEDNANSIYQNSSLNNFEKSKFDKLLNEKFLLYENLFKKAGEENNVEWELLAAISFQESQWDPRAKSNMGVRGMMMLTQETAKSLGITNRIDPRNSIIGGSRHLADISASINYGLTEFDRINFALATYNLGATNINNAIAQIDIEPQSLTWDDLKKELLVLDGDELYFKPQNGYSRGQQTIDFVERTREYALLMRVYSCKDSINQLTAASGI